MSLMETMYQRRSVRKFTSEPVPQEKLDAVLKAGLLAPTSMNRYPCELVVVKDRAVLRQLSEAKKAGARFLADCAAAIAVIADTGKADTWIEDSSIALTYMMLAATDQGLGNCWCQYHLRSDANGGNAEDNVRRILSLPDQYRIVGVLGLGIPDEQPPAKTDDDLDYSMIRQL